MTSAHGCLSVAIVSDADDTQPNRVPQSVTILLEVTEGRPPLTQQDVFLSFASGEAEALRRYDAHAPARDDRLLLDKADREAARDRWVHKLRSGRPVYIEHDRTLRLRTLAVKP